MRTFALVTILILTSTFARGSGVTRINCRTGFELIGLSGGVAQAIAEPILNFWRHRPWLGMEGKATSVLIDALASKLIEHRELLVRESSLKGGYKNADEVEAQDALAQKIAVVIQQISDLEAQLLRTPAGNPPPPPRRAVRHAEEYLEVSEAITVGFSSRRGGIPFELNLYANAFDVKRITGNTQGYTLKLKPKYQYLAKLLFVISRIYRVGPVLSKSASSHVGSGLVVLDWEHPALPRLEEGKDHTASYRIFEDKGQYHFKIVIFTELR